MWVWFWASLFSDFAKIFSNRDLPLSKGAKKQSQSGSPTLLSNKIKDLALVHLTTL